MSALDAALALVFLAAGAAVGYTYFGYPALLALRARRWPAPPVARAPATPDVTIVIVAHNEAGRIGRKLRNCLALDYPRERLEIVVASDGSTDGTCQEVAAFSGEGVRLLELPGPNGKPTALNAAVPLARGEVLLLCDTRQELEPQSLRALTANLADPAVGAVSGELLIRSGGPSAAAEGVGAYWRYEKWIRRTESRVGSTVGVTGAIYAIRRALFPRLDPRTILDDVAVPLHVVRQGRRVVFEPEARAWDEAVGDPRREFRRKVRTLAGNYQLVALDPSLVQPSRNPLFLGFVSHKLARLAVPWCLLAALVASLALALRGSWPFVALVAAQLAFYALAAAGWALRGRPSRPRLVSLAYAVVLLNMAAAGALFGFLSGRQQAAWRAS